MTADRLEHLAELANEAARYYRRSHPAWARTMVVAAHHARLMAAREARAEEAQRIQAELDGIKAALS
jgi:hypothetical protein